jgi:hypothetical protein
MNNDKEPDKASLNDERTVPDCEHSQADWDVQVPIGSQSAESKLGWGACKQYPFPLDLKDYNGMIC